MVEENKINDDTNKKDKKKNVVAENIKNENDFAKVYLKSIRVSPKKLNRIISPIRGLNVEKALNYLSFSLEPYRIVSLCQVSYFLNYSSISRRQTFLSFSLHPFW